MKLILDTHMWLWWTTADPKLSSGAAAAIADPGNDVYFSVASAWEIAIKFALGKIALPSDPETYVMSRLSAQKFDVLDVKAEHALAVARLPHHHRDPFDRLLIAQAEIERMTLVSADPLLARYGVAAIF